MALWILIFMASQKFQCHDLCGMCFENETILWVVVMSFHPEGDNAVQA